MEKRKASNRIERIQPETLVGQYFFRDLYNREVYFEDFDDKSTDYFRLDYNPSMKLHGGKNLISIRGNFVTMESNSEILIEVIDAGGGIVKSQVHDLNDEIHNRVITIDINPNTPPGDVIVTIMGVASEAPDGSAIPTDWVGIPNFRWTRVFSANPFATNDSPIIYNEFSKPSINIVEIKKPFYELDFNSNLSSSVGWTGNSTSSYTLSSSVNTLTKMSYLKSGDSYTITANQPGSSTIDFGGFTEDMEGGILIVRNPQNPRPSSIDGYSATPVYSTIEQGDGLFENGSFQPGAFVTTINQVLSPQEMTVNTPHTTWQGLQTSVLQEFEHIEFADSDFEMIWSQIPISYSANPTGSNGADLNSSYAHVTFDNLEPLTGDVTRIKCYMKNSQTPYDWVIVSDNAVEAQELLYRKDFQKHRAPIGDFSQWGVGHNGVTSVGNYWEVFGVGTSTPTMALYTAQGSNQNPPIEDAITIGTNTEAYNLDGTAFWWLRSKESASFVENQWYEISLKAVSHKTSVPTWNANYGITIQEPKMTIYMSGSAFTDGGDDWGKFIGLIEDTNIKKKHISVDDNNKGREESIKFIFKADGTETAIPQFKIDSGLWYLWDISIKPWDRDGYTPGTWDVIFPTIKANVGVYDSLDFRFEFYNDSGIISNYSATIDNVPWENELTATFTNVVSNTITAGAGGINSTGCITAPCFSGTGGGSVSFTGGSYFSGFSTFNGNAVFNGTSSFNGPATFSAGISSSGPVTLGCPITLPCLTQQDDYMVTVDSSGQLFKSQYQASAGSSYALPIATTTVRGGVELGSATDLTQTYETGSTGTAGRTYPVQLNAADQMAVSVPWTDTGGGGGTSHPPEYTFNATFDILKLHVRISGGYNYWHGAAHESFNDTLWSTGPSNNDTPATTHLLTNNIYNHSGWIIPVDSTILGVSSSMWYAGVDSQLADTGKIYLSLWQTAYSTNNYNTTTANTLTHLISSFHDTAATNLSASSTFELNIIPASTFSVTAGTIIYPRIRRDLDTDIGAGSTQNDVGGSLRGSITIYLQKTV